MNRMLAFGLAVALAVALLPLGSLTAEAAQKAQKGQGQKHHFGRGLDIAVIDGQPVATKQKAKGAGGSGRMLEFQTQQNADRYQKSRTIRSNAAKKQGETEKGMLRKMQ